MNVMRPKKIVYFLFLLPTLLVFLVFTIGPLIPTLEGSFYNYKYMMKSDFSGVQNYVAVLKDPLFWKGMLNSGKLLLLQCLIGVPLSFISAVLIVAQGSKVRRFFKTASFIPSVLSASAVCTMWYMLLSPQFGPIGLVMKQLGLGDWFKPWLSLPESSYNVVCMTYIWQYIGYNMVIFYSGIKAIPEEYFEAATLDGATMIQQVFKLVIPLLQETFKLIFILMISGCLGMVANAQILTFNGLGGAAYTSVLYIFIKAFNELNFGQAYAATMIYAIVCFAIVQIVNALIAKNSLEYT